MEHTQDKLKAVAGTFACDGVFCESVPYGTGHINDTYKTIFRDGNRQVVYIQQRINRNVFRKIPELMENIGRVTRHQRMKFEEAGAGEIDRRVLTLIPTVEDRDFHVDADGEYWRTYLFVEGTVGVDVVQHVDQAYEAARAFGIFQQQLSDLPGRLHETIPRFHHTRSRFNDVRAAVQADPLGRAEGMKKEIAFVMERENMVDVVLDLMASGELPERVTHNDTKLNNVLLDAATGEGMCVIDLDTVMPGSVLYDFGDMIRTMANRAVEDEPDPSKIEMHIEYFEALLRGYLDSAGSVLTEKEIELLPFSGRLITFETGLRFLTDYLQGDRYFKTHREGQNMDRCRKQFKLVESMERQADDMQRLVKRHV